MNIYSSSQIDEIIQELKNENTVAFGTDTVFGLACIINSKKALNKVYSQKQRDKSKKLPMMFSSVDMMKKYVKTDQQIIKLINTFSPGPITYILEALDSNDTIACRIPNDPWIIELIDRINEPLYVTSANISGEESLLKYEDVKEKLNNVDALVKKDASGNKASTIVDATNNFNIIRQGEITEEQIKEALK